MATGVLLMGKGMDTFAPLGPCIATDLDPTNLEIMARLNGEVKQHSNTDDLLFSVAALVAYTSQGIRSIPATASTRVPAPGRRRSRRAT